METRKTFVRVVTIAAFILSYILSIIVIIQILRILFGGSWSVEDVILALMAVNIAVTFSVVGFRPFLGYGHALSFAKSPCADHRTVRERWGTRMSRLSRDRRPARGLAVFSRLGPPSCHRSRVVSTAACRLPWCIPVTIRQGRLDDSGE